jgi:hypothetical protein
MRFSSMYVLSKGYDPMHSHQKKQHLQANGLENPENTRTLLGDLRKFFLHSKWHKMWVTKGERRIQGQLI